MKLAARAWVAQSAPIGAAVIGLRPAEALPGDVGRGPCQATARQTALPRPHAHDSDLRAAGRNARPAGPHASRMPTASPSPASSGKRCSRPAPTRRESTRVTSIAPT